MTSKRDVGDVIPADTAMTEAPKYDRPGKIEELQMRLDHVEDKQEKMESNNDKANSQFGKIELMLQQIVITQDRIVKTQEKQESHDLRLAMLEHTKHADEERDKNIAQENRGLINDLKADMKTGFDKISVTTRYIISIMVPTIVAVVGLIIGLVVKASK